MQATALQLPRDPELRRRLWREWTHVDAPQQTAVVVKPHRGEPPRPPLVLHELISAPLPVLAGLRRAIEAALVDGQLTLGDRQRLLRRAMRLGLSRFEANLMMAAVQHHARPAVIAPPQGARMRMPLTWLVAVVLAVEAASIAALLQLVL